VADTFFADRGGNVVTDTFSMLRALGWMQEEGVEIVNMSLAGPKDALLGMAVKEMSARGTIFVAAAGNGGPAGAPSFPAAYEEVIAVTAVDRKGKNYPNATRGPHIDLAAPGVGIWVAFPGGREGTLTGTSFAAPYVTAVVAAMYASTQSKSSDARLNPKTSFLKKMKPFDLGPAGRDQTYGEGLVQAPETCKRDDRRIPPFRNTPTAQVLWPGVIQNVSLHHD
jgi:subtilisin family serine protease